MVKILYELCKKDILWMNPGWTAGCVTQMASDDALFLDHRSDSTGETLEALFACFALSPPLGLAVF